MAAAVHNPAEKDSFLPPSRWNALAAALDPLEFTDIEIDESYHVPHFHEQSTWGSSHLETELPFYPTSPMEIFLLSMLCTISSLVIAYMMVVLYRCVCTRNYAEWRTSWTKDGQRLSRNPPSLQIVMEAVPIIVAGHNQEVECLVTDGERVVSSCLQGSIKVWDFTNGEIITNINRNMFFELQNEVCNKLQLEKGKGQCSRFDEALHHSEDGHKHVDSSAECILAGRPNKMWQSQFKFKKSSLNQKPEDRRRCSSITGKDKTIYDFALQHRMLYEGSSASSPLNIPKSENSSTEDDQTTKSSLNSVEFDSTQPNCDNLEPEDGDKINCDISEARNCVCIEHGNIDCDVCCADASIADNDSLFISNEVNRQFLLKKCSDSPCNRYISNDLETTADPSHVSDSVNDMSFVSPPAIWCMDIMDDIIVIGCSNGRLEFWEASSGKLKCIFDDGYSGGVSHVTIQEELVLVAARLSGHLDLLQLNHPSNIAQRKSHVRTSSAGSLSINNVHNRFAHKSPSRLRNVFNQEPSAFSFDNEGSTEGLCCVRLNMIRAHQQPISVLECDGRRILTGSQDHTIKVFAMSNPYLSQLYALHGHYGPITCIFIDRISPSVCGSGSQDGKLCVWDLLTGACVYSLQAHDGPICNLSYTASYVMSIGGDEKLCIWDRFRGHLLNSVHIGQGAGGCGLLSLTHSLVVTGGRGGLTVWDASTGMAVRKVHLGHNDGCIFVRQILPLRDSIVCDYANQLRIIRFPHVTKVDTHEANKRE